MTHIFNYLRVLIGVKPLVKYPSASVNDADYWQAYTRAKSRQTTCSLLVLANTRVLTAHFIAFPISMGEIRSHLNETMASSLALPSV